MKRYNLLFQSLTAERSQKIKTRNYFTDSTRRISGAAFKMARSNPALNVSGDNGQVTHVP